MLIQHEHISIRAVAVTGLTQSYNYAVETVQEVFVNSKLRQVVRKDN